MTLPDLKGRGLFVFSDPGGAKPVLALVAMLKTLNSYKIISDRVYSFFSDFGLDVDTYLPGDECAVLEVYKPDFLFTGTSYTSKIELRFITEARKSNLISYSFIDHYTNFEERFLYDDAYVFPDNICVIDEKAKLIGWKTDLPKDRFLVTGNFYHRWLLNWEPVISKEDFFASLNIPLVNKLLVYAPDPLSNVGGVEKFGMDEVSVFANIVQALDKLNNINYSLVIKMHPNQNRDILIKEIPPDEVTYLLAADDIDTNSLLFYSDLVIGIFSSILIESTIMNKDIIRCLIDFKATDPLETNHIGTSAHTISELRQKLESVMVHQ